MSSDQPRVLRLNVLLRQECGRWVAHCPELNTLASDADLETAWEDIVRVCRAHLTYGLKTGRTLAQLIKPPPADILEIIAQAEIDGFLRLHLQPVDHTEFKVFRMIA